MLVFHRASPKTNLTYHYIRLREAGLTRTRIEGPQRLITLRSEDIEARFPGLLGAVLAGARSERRLDVMSGRESLSGSDAAQVEAPAHVDDGPRQACDLRIAARFIDEAPVDLDLVEPGSRA